eukprot:2894610-Rhodomonas_salina.1
MLRHRLPASIHHKRRCSHDAQRCVAVELDRLVRALGSLLLAILARPYAEPDPKLLHRRVEAAHTLIPSLFDDTSLQDSQEVLGAPHHAMQAAGRTVVMRTIPEAGGRVFSVHRRIRNHPQPHADRKRAAQTLTEVAAVMNGALRTRAGCTACVGSMLVAETTPVGRMRLRSIRAPTAAVSAVLRPCVWHWLRPGPAKASSAVHEHPELSALSACLR